MRALLVTLALALTLTGCERDNPVPPDASRPDAQAPDAQVDAGPDAGPVDGGEPIDGGDAGEPSDAGVCDVDGGTCFACAPRTSLEHLNACTTATCEPFPITRARLPLLREDGTLPPLP